MEEPDIQLRREDLNKRKDILSRAVTVVHQFTSEVSHYSLIAALFYKWSSIAGQIK